jgi:natural product biosynthesis luciferase-like monooxygenase protein/FkbM family methyltransferase
MSGGVDRLGDLSPQAQDLLFARLRQAAPRAVGRIAPRPPGQSRGPLSFAQERLWFLSQMMPGDPAYNLPIAIRLAGPLAIAALARSLGEVIRRHEAVRTTFRVEDDQPLQEVAPAGPLELPVVDLGALAPAARERAARQLAWHHARLPCDLERGPLLWAAVLRLGPAEHILLLALHHIAADGWSLGVLIEEAAALYSAFAAGRPSALPALPIQYLDFALWQRAWLSGERLAGLLDHWRRRLAGLPLLELPADRPRRAVPTSRGARISCRLPDALLGELRRLGERGTTPFMTLLAAFDLLLHRYTGQEDLAVGSPIANRNRAEVEGLIGLFMNVVVLRNDLAGDPTWQALLARVTEGALEAYGHQDLPFERLVTELQPERSLGHNPLVNLLLGFQPAPPALALGQELRASTFDLHNGTAKLDLLLSFWEEAGGIAGIAEYACDLFDAVTIERLLGHFVTLLAAACASPAARISELAMLSPAELGQLLREVNDSHAPVPADGAVHRQFERQAARTPGATAVVGDAGALTWEELNARANQIACRLIAAGIAREAAVGVCLDRTPDLVASLLGVLKAGGCYVPLDPLYPAERLALMVEDAGVGLLLRRRDVGPELPLAGVRVIDLGAEEQARGRLDAANPELPCDPEQLAYVIYTSGSTGRPKGVMVSHRNVANFFAGMDGRIPGPPGTLLALTSISFDISVLELLWTLARGFKVVLPADARPGPAMAAAPAREVEMSLFYFASNEDDAGGDGYRLLLEGARFADRRGFAAVWTPERHFHAFGGWYPNPSVTSSAVAAVTERVRIRAGSVVLPLHHPVRVAEEWSVVDNLSRGRVGISFASGWHANDFALAPQNYADRKRVMLRDIATVRGLWRGETHRLATPTGGEIEVRLHPRPVQPELPVWLTSGGSPDTFRMAGEIGANVLTHLLGQSLAELAEKIALYRAAWASGGGRSGRGHVTLMLHTFVGPDLEEVRETVRRPFTDYLRTSADLMRQLAAALHQDVQAPDFTARDWQALLDQGFKRYFETSALFGTPEICLRRLAQLSAIGVDEVACLIDFGVAAERVLAMLEDLDRLRQLARPCGERGSPRPLAAEIAAHGITHLQCTPSLATALELGRQPAAALPAVLLLGGEPLPLALARQVARKEGVELHNMYGPTETTVWSATARVDPDAGTIAIGRPIANTTLYVLGPDWRPVPLGAPGQLWIGGAGVARGYLRQPALTAECFVPDAFGEPGGRLYASGDLARLRPDGSIELLGRVDDQIKVRGHRIEPAEIELALCEQPGIAEAAVVSRDEGPAGRRLVAYLVPERRPAPGAATADPQARAELLARFSHQTLPNGLVVAQHDSRQTHALVSEVFAQEVYGQHGLAYRDGACIFDVGGNIGFFSLYASLACRPARILAFEPIPANCELLRANAALNGAPVTVIPMGVGSGQASAEFTFYPLQAGLSNRMNDRAADRRAVAAIVREGLLAAPGAAVPEPELMAAVEASLRAETVSCPMTTVSQAIRAHGVERIDLLKIDVEGSEVDVLRGIADEDWPRIDQLAIEVHSQQWLAEVREILAQRDFEVACDERIAVAAAPGEEPVRVYMVYARRPGAATGGRPALASPPAPAALRAALGARLPAYMVPERFIVLDALPRTPSGKLDRRALARRRDDTVGRRAGPRLAPVSELERRIAAVWQEVLGGDEPGTDDNFFEVGGNSLLLVQVHRRLREAVGEVSLVELFQHPNIAALARHLGGAADGEPRRSQGAAPVERQSAPWQQSDALARQRSFMEQRRARRRNPDGAP